MVDIHRQESLAASWRRRLAALRAALGLNDRHAWFFRLRARILSYLLQRYGMPAEHMEVPIERAAPVLVDRLDPVDVPRLPRSGEKIRELLLQISTAAH